MILVLFSLHVLQLQKIIKGSTFGQIDHETSINDQQLGFIGSESDRCTELKKRGLCLVPLSMLVNYLG